MSNKIWDRNRAQFFVRIADTANRGNLPARDIFALARKKEPIRQRLRPFSGNLQMDIHFIFKVQRAEIFTRSGETRPADFVPIPFRRDARAEAPQELVLGCLHKHEKSGEMDDAGHIGIGELYFPSCSVFGVHVLYYRMARDRFPSPTDMNDTATLHLREVRDILVVTPRFRIDFPAAIGRIHH